MCQRCEPRPQPRFPEALCAEAPEQHDSTDYGEHMAARERCAVCFSRSSCYLLALGNRDATGTYGGALFRNGVRVLEVVS